MLSVNKINNLNYYEDLAKEDYYLSGGEPPGKWAGLGASMLGLRGQVKPDAYHKIYQGFAPDGTPLCERAGEQHRHGWDFCFAPNKSISVAFARADSLLRQAMQQAQFRAVTEAIAFLEDHAAVSRRGKNGVIHERAAGLVCSLFEHSTSRARDDMQLHTHCLIANLAPRMDSSWGTLESRYLFSWRKAADGIYQSALAQELKALGFTLDHKKHGFEIAGISLHICEHYSQRSKAIEAALAEVGLETSASALGSKLKLTTREHKQAVDRPALFNQWAQELDRYGLTMEVFEAIREPERKPMTPLPLPLQSILEEAVNEKSVIRLQDVYLATAKASQEHGHDRDSIEQTVSQLVKDGSIVELGRDEAQSRLFSTPAMIHLEQELFKKAKYLQQQKQFALPVQQVEQAMDQLEQRVGLVLSNEQAEAVKAATQSGLDILQGAAGAGKSTSMQAIKIAYEASGYEVKGACIAKAAANQLQGETGIQSSTLAKLFDDIERGQTDLNNTVLIIDEAGQISSKDLHKLTQLCTNAKAKLVLVGEDKQLHAITHGGSLRFLSEHLGTARVETIRRQKESWAREAVQKLRIGDTLPALKSHDERKLIHWHDSQLGCIVDAVNHWHRFEQKHPDKQGLMLASNWEQVNQLSNRARSLYQAEGKVGTENIPLSCWVADRKMDFEFSSGDRIKLTKNDYRKGLTNGTLGTITSLEHCLDGSVQIGIREDSGKQISINSSEYCNDEGQVYMAPGYAMTVYSSQGSTVNGDTFVLHHSMMDRASSYVAGSRHKENCHWFIDRAAIDLMDEHQNDQERLASLAELMSRDQQPQLTLDYLKQPQEPKQEVALEIA
jgi:conjugative relaxase-like TrwC/TraI family protein